MKAGTIVRLPDGRVGTAVYNGLDGVGIKWGRHSLSEEDLQQIFRGDGNTMIGRDKAPEAFQWWPDAMLREPNSSDDLPCVGEDYEIVERKL